MSILSVTNLVKKFYVAEKKRGFFSSIGLLLCPSYICHTTLDGISFSVTAGEIVGYIGPNIPDALYKRRRNELIEALQLEKLLQTPARQLSLGQRMRSEIAASLLHNPKILFLDEPTIGFDKERQRLHRRPSHMPFPFRVLQSPDFYKS